MKGIYKCRTICSSFVGGTWKWEITIVSGGQNFIITPKYSRCSTRDSARRSARRIADKLNIEIEFEG